MSDVAANPSPGTLAPRLLILRRWALATLLIVTLLATIVFPQVTKRQDLLNLLFLMFLYITLGQSWNILAGFTGQINLGHAAFFGIGALVTRTVWLTGTAFPIAFALGGIASVTGALVVGIPTFRLRGAYFAIGTLALAEGLRITVGNTDPLISSLSAQTIAHYDLLQRYYLALGLACATMIAAYALLRSRLSLGILALREDEVAAQATGVRILEHKLIALAISSFFAGLAGAAFAFYQVSYYPQAPFQPDWTFDSLLISFVGGLGTLSGPLLGAVFYTLVQQELSLLVPAHQVIFGILFIVVVLAVPGGLVNIAAQLVRLISRIAKPP